MCIFQFVWSKWYKTHGTISLVMSEHWCSVTKCIALQWCNSFKSVFMMFCWHCWASLFSWGEPVNVTCILFQTPSKHTFDKRHEIIDFEMSCISTQTRCKSARKMLIHFCTFMIFSTKQVIFFSFLIEPFILSLMFFKRHHCWLLIHFHIYFSIHSLSFVRISFLHLHLR